MSAVVLERGQETYLDVKSMSVLQPQTKGRRKSNPEPKEEGTPVPTFWNLPRQPTSAILQNSFAMTFPCQLALRVQVPNMMYAPQTKPEPQKLPGPPKYVKKWPSELVFACFGPGEVQIITAPVADTRNDLPMLTLSCFGQAFPVLFRIPWNLRRAARSVCLHASGPD